MKASEPIVAYNTPELQRLKDSLIATIDASTDESKLEQCWALFHGEEFPCVYSEEEFDRLIETLLYGDRRSSDIQGVENQTDYSNAGPD